MTDPERPDWHELLERAEAQAAARAAADEVGEPAFRAIPNDPAARVVGAMFDARSGDWVVTAQGDYQAAAVETMRADGSGYQRVIALEWPGRRNHSDELVTVRLMVHPDDALGLAEVLAHAARWLLSTEPPT